METHIQLHKTIQATSLTIRTVDIPQATVTTILASKEVSL